MELAVYEVVGGGDAAELFDSCWTGEAVQAGLVHQLPDSAFADGDAHAQCEFGMDPSMAVGTTRGDVYFADHAGQPATS